ncbi:MAG: lysylphosphatidylglycerol synthase transmembrane domain-containing protein [Acidimicrobiales bacterium]
MARGTYRNPRRRRLRRGIRWGLGIFVVLLLLEYLVLPELGREGASKSLTLIGKVNFAYLIAGVALEAAALIAYAQLTHTVLPSDSPPRTRLLQINMSSLALSHVVPGGTAPGAALAYRLLTQEGVSGPDTGFALAMQGVGSAVVLNVIFWLALFVSLFFNGYNPLYAVAGSAGVVMMGLFAAVVVMLTRGRRWSVEVVHHLAEKVPFLDADKLAEAVQQIADRLKALADDRELLYRAVGWAAANWLLDAASLWVFIAAFHKIVSPVDLLVAYGLANVLAVIPITPGGLGVVEGVLIPTLVGFHVPSRVALVGVLGYRLVNFWLPIPVGGLSYLSLRFTSQGWRERISTVHKEIIIEHSVPVVEGEPQAPNQGNGSRHDGGSQVATTSSEGEPGSPHQMNRPTRWHLKRVGNDPGHEAV